MSQNAQNEKASALELIAKIHQVQGFDPAAFAVDYTDLNTGEVRKRLPIMPLLAWFRMVYPEGKIAVTATPAKDCFVATAKVYPSYKDGPDCYIGEGTASRGYCAEKPSVSPREWAQTAAIGIALRNAGFGLQFGMVGEDFSSEAPDELGASVGASARADAKRPVSAVEAPEPEPEIKELTLEEKATAAMQLPCPISKYSGKTLGEVLSLDPGAVKWLADKYNKDESIKAGATAICEYAAQMAG